MTETEVLEELLLSIGAPKEERTNLLSWVRNYGEKRARDNAKYSGWSNYETWNAALHISNDEYFEEAVTERAMYYVERDPVLPEKYYFGEWIEEFVDNFYREIIESPVGMWGDLLTHAVGQVNWGEIAEGYLDDAKAEWLEDNPEEKEEEANDE